MEFFGNREALSTLEQMIRGGRMPQTLLLSGAEGVGKATLARRFAGKLLGREDLIERDDLSLPENAQIIGERERWSSEDRVDDPLLFSSHPDFVTFPPEGPLRQISIHQMRLLKERAQFKPLKGERRVFLIDHIDRANEQAANSLLKTLEEPPAHLILVLTAENPYDLLPTIRSRAVPLYLGTLDEAEMKQFIAARKLDNPERRLALAAGSPGLAASIDLEQYDRRRQAMLNLLKAAAGSLSIADWVRQSEIISQQRQEKLENYLKVLYQLLEDMLWLANGAGHIRNIDLSSELTALAGKTGFQWLRTAVTRLDELVEMARRNIQKSIALDALVVELRTDRLLCYQ